MQTRSDRALLKRETRLFTAKAQVRADSDDTLGLTGYACVTGVPYEVNDWLGTYSETVEPGSFTKTLAERDDVRLLLNHDGLPMARTKSGTLRLSEDNTGLATDADLDKRSTLTNDVAVAMERGDLDQMSFAFQVTRQEWNDDYTQRFIREVKLFDVSVVTYPANPSTSVKLRGLDLVDVLDDDDLRELLARGQRRLTPSAPADPDLQLRLAAALAL
jgi:HK97 family phage prohead protease